MRDGRLVVAQVVLSLGWGGLERVALDLARGLDQRRYEPLVISLTGHTPRADEFAAAGVPVVVVPQRGFDLGLPRRLAEVFLRERVDIVHAHNFGRYFYAGPAARLAGLPSLYTEHSNTRPDERALWLGQRRLSELADRIVPVSNSVREYLVARQGIDPERIEVVPNGIDVAAYAAADQRAEARAEAGIPPDAVVVGTVGRMVPVKNHALLLGAFAPLAAELPAYLAIAGDGGARLETERLAAELGLAERVRFLGMRRDIPRVLAMLDIFALSSDSEGLPLAVIEAMAAGLPIAATAVGGVVELVEQRTGLLSPRGDVIALSESLKRLAHDTELRRRMGDEGCRIARRRYSLAAMLERYAAIYDELAGRVRDTPGAR